jgi:hypothetical protein
VHKLASGESESVGCGHFTIGKSNIEQANTNVSHREAHGDSESNANAHP